MSAVAFLEPRKSPIDVIQAVGRAMRTAPGKDMGYIICPILLPPNVDPESWLSISSQDEGWQELGQILLALRAHDQRIEDQLEDLLYLYIPPPPPEGERTIVAIADGERKRIRYAEHEGAPGEVQKAVERVLDGQRKPSDEFRGIAKTTGGCTAKSEPMQIITGKKNSDGSRELRQHTVVRQKPQPDGTRGAVDYKKSKAKAKKMINEGEGVRLPPSSRQRAPRRSREEVARQSAMRMLRLSGMEEHGNAIKLNLLTKSGLSDDRVIRDLNILESSIREAAHHLRSDELVAPLNRHFGLDNLKEASLKKQADGCTIAALLLMNAAMLHQRISNGRWLPGISDLATVKNVTNVVQTVVRQWQDVRSYDFRPVVEPALESIYAIEETGKAGGLERALRHITAEAERIAETYADMGADHAGPLFNRVMGNQASDGAFFTRPPAASLAARLTLDTCGDADWSAEAVWRQHKTVDLACGSGTLLAAVLTDMKRRARAMGADEQRIARLQKLGVEHVIKGLDINPVSLQLAASQLTAGNQDIRYRQMGLHLMPYGPDKHDATRIDVGTLELLGQQAIVPRHGELGLADDAIGSRVVWDPSDDAELEDAVDAARDARIVIMNPPFTNRAKMGEKFPAATQQRLRTRVDAMEDILVNEDQKLEGFMGNSSVGPLFVALADRCTNSENGTLTMIHPTIALCNPSGLRERRILAQRYHIHTVLTSHQPRQSNLGQNSAINESIVMARRHDGPKPPTRFIQLDRMPSHESEVQDLHHQILRRREGQMENGWGEISFWPSHRMEAGDWTAAVWRSYELAEAAAKYADHPDLRTIVALPALSVHQTGRELSGSFERVDHPAIGSFPVLDAARADAQTTIQSTPDEWWIPKKRNDSVRRRNGGTYPETDRILKKAGYLLITAAQDNGTARLTATASDIKYVGNSWLPVAGLSAEEAKATAVFMNSTPGRLQLMRNLGRKLTFPIYRPAGVGNIKIPNVGDERLRSILVDCWERTKDMVVPQFRDGECEVRTLWDEAVAAAMGWDARQLARQRALLNNEPHVRGLGYNQYADEPEETTATAV